MATYIGSSGTMIGAALETTGYYYQSLLLDTLGEPFSHEVGGLIYVVGLILGLVSFAVLGRYKLGMWMLIGPPLFFSLIFIRTETNGVSWKFGGEPRDNERVVQQVEKHIGQNLGGEFASGETLAPAKVSTVFSKYNAVVSEGVQNAVNVINSGRKDVDYGFLLRGQLFGQLRGSGIDDPNFRELLHLAFLHDCRDVIEAGRRMRAVPGGAKGEADPEYDEYKRLLKDTRVSLSPKALEYTINMIVGYIDDNNPDLLYKLRYVDSRSSVSRWLNQFDSQYFRTRGRLTAPEWNLLVQDLKERFANPANNSFQCGEVWTLVLHGLLRDANRKLKAVEGTADAFGYKEKVVKDLTDIWGFTALSQSGFQGRGGQEDGVLRLDALIKIVARQTLKNEIERGNISSFLQNFANKTDLQRVLNFTSESDLAGVERHRIASNEWAEKTKLMFAALNLPYYQGLALMILSITFPFFGLLLLIPGKHGGFLLWCMLWLWVKSWDVFFAVVMLLDDVFFSIVKWEQAATAGKIGRGLEIDPDLSMSLYSLNEVDPAFQPTTYYSIIAIALLSIPMVSAHLVLGGLKGGAGIIAKGIDDLGSHFSSAAYSAQVQQTISSLRAEASEMETQRGKDYVGNEAKGAMRHAGYSNPDSAVSMQSTEVRSGLYQGMSHDQTGSRVKWARTLGRVSREIGRDRDIIGGGVDEFDRAGRGGGGGGGGGGAAMRIGQRSRLMSGDTTGGKARMAAFTFGADVADAYADKLLEIRGADLDKAGAWAGYDAINSFEVQERGALARIYNMFEIPWVDRAGYDEELASDITRWEQDIKFKVAVVGAALKGVGNMIGKSAPEDGPIPSLKEIARDTAIQIVEIGVVQAGMSQMGQGPTGGSQTVPNVHTSGTGTEADSQTGKK